MEQRDQGQPEKALHGFERISTPSEWKNPNVPEIIVDSVDFGNVIGPARRVSIKSDDFIKNVVHGGIYPNFIDIENRVLSGINSYSLNDSLIVGVALFRRIESQRCGVLRFLDEEIQDVSQYATADCRSGLFRCLIRRIQRRHLEA